jgi:hypothetical protein
MGSFEIRLIVALLLIFLPTVLFAPVLSVTGTADTWMSWFGYGCWGVSFILFFSTVFSMFFKRPSVFGYVLFAAYTLLILVAIIKLIFAWIELSP